MMLKIGDVIYKKQYGEICSVSTIVKVTKTLAIANNGDRFKLDDSIYIKVYGAQSWDNSCYMTESESLKLELKLLILKRKVDKLSFSNLRIDQLEDIIKIVNKSKND